MKKIVIDTLINCNDLNNEKGECFELFGYDFMID